MNQAIPIVLCTILAATALPLTSANVGLPSGEHYNLNILDKERMYDNNGLRLAQLRFYPIHADISGPCPAA